VKTAASRLLFSVFLGIIFSFLAACSPPPPVPYLSVEKVGIAENAVYARAVQHCGGYGDCGVGTEWAYFVSRDHGQTWSELAAPPAAIKRSIDEIQEKEFSACLSTNSATCYRMTGADEVEVSKDGGNTWKSDWRLPVGRKTYMERSPQRLQGVALDTAPIDLGIIETNAEHFVVVALGNQGVLVRTPAGKWERYAVGSAVPIPYQAANFTEASQVLFAEHIEAFLAATMIFLLLSLCTWLSAYINSDKVLRKKVLRALLPLGFAVTIFLLYHVLDAFSGGSRSFDSPIPRSVVFWSRIVISLLPVLGFVVTWIAVILVVEGRKLGFLALLFAILYSVLFDFGILFPLQLWALGPIPVYAVAQMIATVVGMLLLLAGLIMEYRISSRAVRIVN
jgi:hypothetical protein